MVMNLGAVILFFPFLLFEWMRTCESENIDGVSRDMLRLAKRGGFRGNRTPLLIWAICASLRPLDVHEYVGGSQSCVNRLI
jgi:hypothetical protein